MTLTVTVLGCGTSSGVPRIGNDWGACDPAEPRNRRSRAALLIESATTRILVDTGPDMRTQLLAAGIGTVDAVLWTHDHADHSHGIDDLRQIFHNRGSPIPVYGRSDTLASLDARFGYAFHGKHGYPPTLDAALLADRQRIGDIDVHVVDQPHGQTRSAGLRFDHGGHRIGYATDFNVMTADMHELYRDLDLWIVDALRRVPHPSHPTLAETCGWIASLTPREAVLTHMDQSMDYRALLAELPAGIVPGHDGLIRRFA